MFTSSVRVRFDDVDHAGVVYYPRFLHFFHVVFEDFWRAEGRPLESMIANDGVGLPAVRTEVDHARPLRLGDVLDVALWVPEVGKGSATFAYRGTVAVAGTPKVVASAKVVVACIDMKTFRPAPLPEAYAVLLAAHATGPT